MTERCTHYACRCARAAELAEMSDRYGRPSLMIEAINVHDSYVTCRQVKLPEGPRPEGTSLSEATELAPRGGGFT
jgi:hypothetical protein